MNKVILYLCFLIGMAGAANAQTPVTSVRYNLKYNAATCNYNVYMYLETGSILPGKYQLVSTNQVSIVVPQGTTVGSPISNEPKGLAAGGISVNSTCDFTYTRNTTPKIWGNSVATSNNPALPGKDIYAFTVSPTGAYWPVTAQGDSILLFSISIASTSCGSGIRLWNNNEIKGIPVTGGDPTSTALGASDPQDYNNGMNLYNSRTGICDPATSQTYTYNYAQTYNGNRASNTSMPLPTITPFTLGISGGNITASSAITSGAASCISLQSYTWSKPSPNSYSNTTAVSGTSATATLSRPLNAANLGTYTLTVTNINGCTASASNSIALPIKLLSFKGAANKCAAQLSWEVAHGEKDFQGFDLQYSTDGAHFGTISHVERSQYNDAYSSSYIQASGKGYYRLKVTDLAGKESYSETVIVTTDCDNPEITIAPNPTQALSTVSGIASGDQVKVTDMLGNVIANYVSGGSKATIDLGIFPSGIYSVMISRGTDILKTAKITKL